MFPLLLVQMGFGLFRHLWVYRRRTNRRSCCPPTSNLSNSPWTAWPDGSVRWDNQMAAQHLPRNLVRPSSGLNNYLKRRRRTYPLTRTNHDSHQVLATVSHNNVIETATFETENRLKLGGRYFIKNSEAETLDLKFETETRDFKICGFCRNLS